MPRHTGLCTLLALGAAFLVGGRPTFAAPSDFLSEPVREGTTLVFDVRHPVAIAVREVGSLSEMRLNPEAPVCQIKVETEDDHHCIVDVTQKQNEVALVQEDGSLGLGWAQEEPAKVPGDLALTRQPSEPFFIETTLVATAVLRWKIFQPQGAPVQWFEFQVADVDTSPTGNTAPVWTALDSPDPWQYCSSNGTATFTCVRDVLYQHARYRLRACNYSGCGGWSEEPYVACTPRIGLSGAAASPGGCPCLHFPSPVTPACVP